MSLSSEIREFALGLGYDRVGFAPADDFPLYRDELNQRQEYENWDLKESLIKTADPRNILPEARSIIALVYDYAKQAFPVELIGKIGRYYMGYGDYGRPINRARLRLLVEFLEKRGFLVGRNSSTPARLTGARAGVTNFGKNCFAYAEGIGSSIVILSIVTNAELNYDTPTMEVKCPEDCTLCLDSCPTGSLYKPLHMDPQLCIAFNTYTTHRPIPQKGSPILTPEIRAKMGTWIYGCDICQQVCPRNQTHWKSILPSDPYLEYMSRYYGLERLVNISDADFASISEMLHYIKEKRYYQRNAAVALGNCGEGVLALEKAVIDHDEIVRGHAAWALGRLNTTVSRRILESKLKKETSEYVLSEIKAALI